MNLNGFSVLGGSADQGGLQNANISVGKNINGLNIPHGIFRSWITAGVSINGGSGSASTGGIGADGVTAIYNSEIDAGTSISNLAIGGDVKSGFPDRRHHRLPDPDRCREGPLDRRDQGPRRGHFSAQRFDRFAHCPPPIDGALIDAVLAASVAPYGGDGTLPQPPSYDNPPPPPPTPPAGFSNYQAPGGLTDGTPNYSIRDVRRWCSRPDAAWLGPEGSAPRYRPHQRVDRRDGHRRRDLDPVAEPERPIRLRGALRREHGRS